MNDKVTIEEIEKWASKLDDVSENVEIFDTRGESMLGNMRAYISDSQHFKQQGDLVRSFEALVWAWAIFEICSELGVFNQKSTEDE
ncbi:MAG TPA: DUF357 domain-containing protein [archaeon]|nr:DUF357 domain-containing protein [archaeon]